MRPGRVLARVWGEYGGRAVGGGLFRGARPGRLQRCTPPDRIRFLSRASSNFDGWDIGRDVFSAFGRAHCATPAGQQPARRRSLAGDRQQLLRL